MKKIREIVVRYNHGGFTEDVFKNYREEIIVTNSHSLANVCMSGIIIAGILLIASFLLSERKDLNMQYLMLLVVCGTLYFLNLEFRERFLKGVLPLLYIFVFLLYFVGILLGLSTPDMNATTICVLFAVVPTFILDNPLKGNGISLFMGILYSALAWQIKDNSVARLDILNVACFVCLGWFVQFFNAHTKLENLLIRSEIEKQRDIDSLTAVYNRRAVEPLINRYLEGREVRAAVLLIDVDNFKTVNDTFGHGMGDQVLKEVAQTLKAHFRRNDIISRIGGDEFLVFIPEIKNEAWIMDRGEVLSEALKRTVEKDGIKCRISGSVGLAMAPEGGRTYEELYKNADAAMYETKKNGKSGISVFHRA